MVICLRIGIVMGVCENSNET